MDTEKQFPNVTIVYLLWDEEPKRYLTDAIAGVATQTYPKSAMRFLVIYNSHKPETESQESYIKETLSAHQETLPEIVCLPQKENLGFSGGNNAGMRWAIEHESKYVFLHNADGLLGPACIEELVLGMENDASIGVAQAMVLLHPETNLVNSSGNEFHFLGFGYSRDYRVPIADCRITHIEDIGYASGAALLMRTDLLTLHGLWEEAYFMYHEDTDYSLRLRLLGFRAVVVPNAIFFHKYSFAKSIQKYFWIERNRYTLLFLFYRLRTIVLILPMLFAVEIGLFFFSIKGGWWREKLRVYAYWIRPAHWRMWTPKRRAIQRARILGDKALLHRSTAVILFQESEMMHPLIHFVANPIMRAYFFFVRLLVWW